MQTVFQAPNVLKAELVVKLRESDKVRGISLDVCEGKVYLTNWNPKRPTVSRVWFSGYGLEDVVTTDIRMPNAVATDPNARKFYWADARLDKVKTTRIEYGRLFLYAFLKSAQVINLR